MADVSTEHAGVLRGVDAVLVRVPAVAEPLGAVTGVRAGDSGSVVQHRRLVRDEHELAVVFGRVHDGLPGADGWVGGPELRVGSGGYRYRDRADPWFHSL